VTGLARSCGWLSMYVGLPWIHDRGRAMARAAVDRLAAIDGVEMLTPRDRMATLVTFRIRGWEAGPPSTRSPRGPSRSPGRSRSSTPPAQRRLLHDRSRDRAGGGGGRAARRAHARVAPAAAAAHDHRSGRRAMTGQPPAPAGVPRAAVRRRSWLEIRWRQFRNAPRPVVRAVLSSLVVALVLGFGYLPTTSRSAAARACPAVTSGCSTSSSTSRSFSSSAAS
jgi:hypothetical protein